MKEKWLLVEELSSSPMPFVPILHHLLSTQFYVYKALLICTIES